jgi:hypothetical protein
MVKYWNTWLGSTRTTMSDVMSESRDAYGQLNQWRGTPVPRHLKQSRSNSNETISSQDVFCSCCRAQYSPATPESQAISWTVAILAAAILCLENGLDLPTSQIVIFAYFLWSGQSRGNLASFCQSAESSYLVCNDVISTSSVRLNSLIWSSRL